MKRNLFLLTALFLIGVLISSCEKDNNSGSARLRIVKIADNVAMENPLFVFEYGSDDLLSSIIEEYLTSKWISEIVYNSSSKPVAVNRKFYSNGSLENESTKNIGWNENGFEIYSSDGYSRYIYLLNSQNELDSKISMDKNDFTQEFETTSVQYFTWTGNNQVKRVFDYESPWSIETAEYEETFKFVDNNSPFKGISISILFAAGIELGEWEGEIQNNYCLSEYIESSFSASISYEFNEQNFPTRADITYTSEEGVEHDYVYFEYESY